MAFKLEYLPLGGSFKIRGSLNAILCARELGKLSAQAAAEIAETAGALQLHAYDLPDIVAGAATIGLELREQLPKPLDVLVASVEVAWPVD